MSEKNYCDWLINGANEDICNYVNETYLMSALKSIEI